MPEDYRMLDDLDGLQGLQLLFTQHPLFLTGGLLLLGYIAGKLAIRLRLPEISGFIIVGVVVGHVGHLVSHEMEGVLHVLTEVAIGFLALTIGGEFAASRLRRIGRDVLVIALAGLVGTFALVLAGCSLLGYFVPALSLGYPYAILLAVIACATSPAVIVAEVHHMRAHGRFIDILFGVVALGDAITVILFGVAFSFVMNLLGAGGGSAVLGESLREILLAVLIGGLGALPLSYLIRDVRSGNELMIITVGFVFVITGITITLHLSPLLVNMLLGAVLVNLPGRNTRVLHAVEPFTPPIYALFFIIAGLEIDLGVVTSAAGLVAGAAYILLRGLARSVSFAVGSKLRGISARVGNYLGMCTYSTSPLLEAVRGQPGVYALLSDLVNIVLLSIFVNELLSPLFLRYGVERGNEMEAE
jgi:Kef-type K+ transport system membrane component KefB